MNKPLSGPVNSFAAEMRRDHALRCKDRFSRTLEEAGFEPRLREILGGKKVKTLEDLSLFSEEELLETEGIEPADVRTIRSKLSDAGLALNPPLSSRSPEEFKELWPGFRKIRKRVIVKRTLFGE
ncbi:MAG: hypothetical protein J6332_07815 [Abditibacteriota bacterium]|nr:hypothetical protein [Abditibacteriota bacterium]